MAAHPSTVDLFFCDTETGGTDPDRHEVLEVAGIRTDPTGRKVLAEYTTRIVVDPALVDPEAAAINGYDQQLWAETAVARGDAVRKLVLLAQSAIFTAHKVEFDWSFVSQMFNAEEVGWPGRYYRIDTVGMAMPLLMQGLVPDLKLATLCGYFGITQSEAHRADSDVEDCRQIYVAMMDCLGPALAAGRPASAKPQARTAASAPEDFGPCEMAGCRGVLVRKTVTPSRGRSAGIPTDIISCSDQRFGEHGTCNRTTDWNPNLAAYADRKARAAAAGAGAR